MTQTNWRVMVECLDPTSSWCPYRRPASTAAGRCEHAMEIRSNHPSPDGVGWQQTRIFICNRPSCGEEPSKR